MDLKVLICRQHPEREFLPALGSYLDAFAQPPVAHSAFKMGLLRTKKLTACRKRHAASPVGLMYIQ